MQVFKDEIQITRGENCTYDTIVKNNDNSPYLISSKLVNPYWLITIATGKYYEHGRAVFNYWLPIPKRTVTNIKLFRPLSTANFGVADPWYSSYNILDDESKKMLPMRVGDYIVDNKGRIGIITSVGDNTFNFELATELGEASTYNSDYEEPNRFYVTKPIEIMADTISDNVAPYDLFDTKTKAEIYKLVAEGIVSPDIDDYSLFYLDAYDRKFYYWNGQEYKEYSGTNLIIHFNTLDTLTWVEQEYNFSIKVVDGVLKDDLTKIRSHEQPLQNFSYMDKINGPSKLSVYSNIDGSMEVINERTQYNT